MGQTWYLSAPDLSAVLSDAHERIFFNFETIRSLFGGTETPANPVIGQPFFNTATLTLYIWNGTEWQAMASFDDVGSNPEPPEQQPEPPAGQSFYPTSPNEYETNAEKWLRIRYNFAALRSSFYGTEAPSDPAPLSGQFWYDGTSIYIWNGSSWSKYYTADEADVLLAEKEKRIYKQATEPSEALSDDLWVQTGISPEGFFRYTGSTWNEIGGPDAPTYEERIVTSGEAASGIIDLSSMTYTVGNHSLMVFLNGLFMRVDSDYTETDTDTVTFASGVLTEDDCVIFRY